MTKKKLDKDLDKITGGEFLSDDSNSKSNERKFDGLYFYNKVPKQCLDLRVAFYFVHDGKKDWYYGRLINIKSETSMCITTTKYEIECFKRGNGNNIEGYTNTIKLSDSDYTVYSDMIIE